LKAWVAMGELSVRMVVPMAMKKLPWFVSERRRLLYGMHTQMLPLIPSCIVPAFAAFH
jgi:hypothetical protein